MNKKLIQLKNLLRRKEKPADLLKRIYKDKNGNDYYGFRDYRELPAQRVRLSEIGHIEADLCITAKDGSMLISAAIDKFEAWAKSPKSTGLSDALAIMVELKRRFESLAEEETLQKLASVYFVMNNEDPYHYVSSQQQAKLDAWDLSLIHI